jgi:hypothetical protein
MKALWIVEANGRGPITLHGSRVGGGRPLSFSIQQAEPATAAVLDPEHPAIPIQHGSWREFPSYLYFPETGCYELVAEWSGGSWRATIPFVAPEDVPAEATPLP